MKQLSVHISSIQQEAAVRQNESVEKTLTLVLGYGALNARQRALKGCCSRHIHFHLVLLITGHHIMSD